MRNSVLKILGFVGLVALLSPSSLLATPTIALRLSSGAQTVTVVDGDPMDANLTAGAVTYNGNVAGWLLNVATGQGTPYLSLGSMDLNSVDTMGVGNPAPLTISFSEISANPIPAAAFDMSIGGTVKNIAITYTAYYSSSSSFFATDHMIGSLGAYQSLLNVQGFNGDLNGQPVNGPVMSLTQVLTITAPVANAPAAAVRHMFSGDATLDPIPTPEPSALFLLGSALLGTGGIMRKRLKRS